MYSFSANFQVERMEVAHEIVNLVIDGCFSGLYVFGRNILYQENYFILSVALTERKKWKGGGRSKKKEHFKKEGKKETWK